MYKFVVIDDEQKSRSGIINLVKKIKPAYIFAGEAANGTDGMAVIRAAAPDIVITDIKMPLMDGIDMLTKLKKEDLDFIPVILSGYADFEYARNAIKVGVCDYLLKPVSIDSLIELLEQVELKLAMKSDLLSEESFKTLAKNMLLNNIVQGSKPYDRVHQILYRNTNILIAYLNSCADKKLYDQSVDRLYTEEVSESGSSAGLDLLHEKIGSYFSCRGKTCTILSIPERCCVVVLHPYGDLSEEIDRGIAAAVDLNRQERFTMDKPFCILSSRPLKQNDLPMDFSLCFRQLKWAIVLGNQNVLSKSLLDKTHTLPFTYPEEIEKNIVSALCSCDFQHATEETERFFNYCSAGVFYPGTVIEACACLITTIQGKCKELNYSSYKYINQAALLKRLIDSYSNEEMKQLVLGLLDILFHEETPQYGLIVKKTMKLISRDYNQGLTLKSVASALNITPEYLSTLFSKETGQPFSSYLMQFRVNKAKQLLMTGHYKIYNIAEMVGYSDSKYFCKVFRKMTGMSAGSFVQQVL